MILPNDAITKAYDELLESEKNKKDEFNPDERLSVYCGCGKDISKQFEDATNKEIEHVIEDHDIIKSCGGQFCMP